MSTHCSPAKAGAQTPEGPTFPRSRQALLRFACNEWAPAFVGEQVPS